ncbi:MAG: hypothetical protein WD771_01445 [Gemmatimonadaceae bacterium]
MRPIRLFLIAVTLGAALTAAPSPAAAQDLEITVDLLDRFVIAYDREKEDLGALEPELAAVDEKIRKFRECKIAFEAAGSATGSRLGGLAARAGIRARCGANSEADIARERRAIIARATQGAATANGFTVPQYSRLKTRLERVYAYGDRAGLKEGELAAVDARRERFASVYGASGDLQAVADAISSLGGAGAGPRMAPGQWTADASWMFVGQLFGMMFATGANVLEAPYEPGQWTRWRMGGDGDDDYTIERAFLTRTDDGGEWWRYRSVSGDRQSADTVVLEGLFKPEGGGMLQLVRMRGRMPGEKEANEMMVPQQMTMVSTLGMFGMRPTEESVEGATVGTERVTTPAGAFSAKLVRFGGAGGRQEWWLADNVPGGWVRYRASAPGGDESFTMELIAHGTGATSELGAR